MYKSKKATKYALSFLVVALLAATYFVLFLSPLFKVDQPIIVGTNRVDKDKLARIVQPYLAGYHWGLFPKRVLFVINPKQIESALVSATPAVAAIEVRKEIPNILKVAVTEKEPLAIWSAGGQFFFVDEKGVAYDKIQRSESSDANIPVIADEHNKPTVQGDRVITKITLSFLKTISDSFITLNDLSVNFFVAPSRLAPDLTVVTNDGWKIIFDTSQDALAQINALKEVLKSQVDDPKKLEYIDLRIPGRVFVK